MGFNEDPVLSCNDLSLYRGDMTLVPHQGDASSGVGTVELACGAASRHLRIRFEQTNGKTCSLPGSVDGYYGAATSFMRLPLSEKFFLFVTSISDHKLIGESTLITGDAERDCDHFEIYLLNCLTPSTNTSWAIGDWLVTSARTRCAYDLTRVSLPTHELNLTHKLTLTRKDQKVFRWSSFASGLDKLLLFLSFANCSRVSSPVIYGFSGGEIQFFRFEAPLRSVPTNRRSWATQLSQSDVNAGLSCFLKAVDNDFWASILKRAIEWQILTDASI